MASSTTAPSKRASAAEADVRYSWGLHATVVGTGAAVMAIEVMGTRLLGPTFGTGLFVWAALLAVTLCSLAIGYYAGGAWADRNPTTRPLGLTILLAALTSALVVPFSRPLLSFTLNLGPRPGPLVAGVLLFTLPLALLGAVSPMAIRLTTHDVRLAGHRSGGVYAVSTAGSLVGTLLISFWAIPNYETTTILLWISAMLAGVGAFWLAGAARGAALVATALLPLAALSPGERPLPKELEVVTRIHSPYSLLEVIDDEERQVRFLRADHSVIGGLSLRTKGVIFDYLRMLDAAPALRPDAKKVLQIGMGTGALAGLLHKRGLEVDVVEIDPGVVQLASDYFGFKASGQVHVEDARTFLISAQPGYDIIVHDTFTGGTSPPHLLSLEVVQRIKQLLRPNGLLALSFVGFAAGQHVETMNAVYKTVTAVFPNARIFCDSGSSHSATELANLLVFASDGPLDFANLQDVSPQARELFSTGELKPAPTDSIITDERNPLSQLQLPIADAHFHAMEQLLPRAVWLP